MSRTKSSQMLPVFLPRGWEGLKDTLEKAAAQQIVDDRKTVSGLVRHFIQQGLVTLQEGQHVQNE